MISTVECLGIAAGININAKALGAALEYFDDLNIFLYYPSVLLPTVLTTLATDWPQEATLSVAINSYIGNCWPNCTTVRITLQLCF